MVILDGKFSAELGRKGLKDYIEANIDQVGRRPTLTIISFGDDPASRTYVANKKKACHEVGISVKHFAMQEILPFEDIKALINFENRSPNVDGIMVQLPLPDCYDERAILDLIDPKKDVDGLTTTNIGRLRSGEEGMRPCTAKGIMDLLSVYNYNVDGKNVVIIGRSNIVGKPLADMMMAAGATVTQCHSHTRDLAEHTRFADIIVSAVGKPGFITGEHLGRNQILIDVGINRNEEGKICGDISPVQELFYAQAMTPVPGGVGPMTVFELLNNTAIAWRENFKKAEGEES